MTAIGRSPHGERGLKHWYNVANDKIMSLPTRGAWIETGLSPTITLTCQSLPTRGAWIETNLTLSLRGIRAGVAPHTGSVD